MRDRAGDMELLIRHTLARVNEDGEGQPGSWPKRLSPDARRLLCNHVWPGNMRELINTITRASVFAMGKTIGVQEIRRAMLQPTVTQPKILHRPLGPGLDLSELMAEVARHYLQRAMEQTQGKKAKASKLLGFSNYQTMNNWLKKYKVPSG